MYCTLPYSTKVLTLVYALSPVCSSQPAGFQPRREPDAEEERQEQKGIGCTARSVKRGGGGVKLISVAGLGGAGVGSSLPCSWFVECSSRLLLAGLVGDGSWDRKLWPRFFMVGLDGASTFLLVHRTGSGFAAQGSANKNQYCTIDNVRGGADAQKNRTGARNLGGAECRYRAAV
jgi:hypothetical protein